MEDLNDLAEQYRQGLSEEAYVFLRKRGLSDHTINTASLGFVEEGRYSNAVSIPYFDARGSVVTIRFRYLDPSVRGYKYDSLQGSSMHLYGVKNVDEDKLWLAEGEFDTLILNQLGFPAVGLAGANGFKTAWRWLFSTVDVCTLVMDGDPAGRKAAARLASILGSSNAEIRLVELPEGKDITDMYLENEHELRALIQ